MRRHFLSDIAIFASMDAAKSTICLSFSSSSEIFGAAGALCFFLPNNPMATERSNEM